MLSAAHKDTTGAVRTPAAGRWLGRLVYKRIKVSFMIHQDEDVVMHIWIPRCLRQEDERVIHYDMFHQIMERNNESEQFRKKTQACFSDELNIMVKTPNIPSKTRRILI